MPAGARDVRGAHAGCLLWPLLAGIPWRMQPRVLTLMLEGLTGKHDAGLLMVDLKLHNIGLLDGVSWEAREFRAAAQGAHEFVCH
jgi:hypothetical protein